MPTEALIFLLLGNLNLFIVHRKHNDDKILETKFKFFVAKKLFQCSHCLNKI
jgi:hypothetical protein